MRPLTSPGPRAGRPAAPWAITGSIAVHAVFALLLWSLPMAVVPGAPRVRGLEVELMTIRRPPPAAPSATGPTASEGGASSVDPNGRASPPAAAPEPAQPPATSLEQPVVGPDDMVRADHLMSSDVLADPRSRAARAALAGFGDADRMVQLCGIEAMEQVHAWDTRLQPDSVVAYAMAETQIGDHAVVADGGAIRTGQTWLSLAFRCDLAPDHSRVVAFRFRLGAPIPRAAWEEHNLPEGGEPLE